MTGPDTAMPRQTSVAPALGHALVLALVGHDPELRAVVLSVIDDRWQGTDDEVTTLVRLVLLALSFHPRGVT